MKVNVYNDTQSIDLEFIQNSYEILDWDSNFFAFKVCKIKANNLTDAELEAVLAYLSATEVELIYYSSEREISAKAKKSDYFQIKLVDKKTTLVKNITKNRCPFAKEFKVGTKDAMVRPIIIYLFLPLERYRNSRGILTNLK